MSASVGIRNARIAAKFTELANLGIVRVGDDYSHKNRVETFIKQFGKGLSHCDETLTDENFADPSYVIEPGDKFWVRVFRAKVTWTSSAERLNFLAMQETVYLGVQGLTLVFVQKLRDLPGGLWYSSFDKKKRLPRNVRGKYLVPDIGIYPEGYVDFGLTIWDGPWSNAHAFLCFNKIR